MVVSSPIHVVTRPSTFFSSLAEKDSLRRGIVIFSLACVTTLAASAYYYMNKVRYVLALGPFSTIELQILRADYIVMSKLTYLFLAVLVLLGISRIFARLIRAREVGIKTFISAVLHSFFIILLINVASAPLLLLYPGQSYGVVGADFENVYLLNATLTGVTAEEKIPVEVRNQHVSAERMEVRYLDGSGNPVDWDAVSPQDAAKILHSSKPSVTLVDAVIAGVNIDTPTTIIVHEVSFKEMLFRRTTSIDRVLLNREELLQNPLNVVMEFIGSLISPISWLWLIMVNAVSFRTLYGSSKKAAAGVGVVVYLAFIFLGIS